MVNFEMKYEYNTKPPNVVEQILGHPTGIDKAIELGLFNEHRFSFYFWAKWRKELEVSPDLITFDWHQDLAYPNDNDKTELKEIDLNNFYEISFYSWARLNPLNDDHIVSAAYLDLINDIWIVCKQDNGFDDKEIIDLNGKRHNIFRFRTVDELYKRINKKNIKNVFFDIDVDFFTVENSTSNDKNYYSYIEDEDINRFFSIDSDLMQWIFNRIEGITIALEPEHTGGIIKSLEFLNTLENFWFTHSIGNQNCEWTELIKQKLEIN